MPVRPGFLALVLLLTPLCAVAAGSVAQKPPCQGERVAVVPLDLVGVTPRDAREEEEKVRAALERLSGLCVIPRGESAGVLRQMDGQRLPVCDTVDCRKRLAQAFGADWLYSGTVYGFGGGRTVMMTLWNAEGTLVQRGSFASGRTASNERVAGETLERLLREARLGRSVADAVPLGASDSVGRDGPWWPRIVMGSAAIVALTAGAVYASSAADTSSRLAQGRTGCAGTGAEYERCFSSLARTGERQATTANVLFGAGALLGAGAAVLFVVDLP